MDDEEYWDIIPIEDIAEEFRIPWLADLIQRNEKVKVNMDHISGWFEEDGQRFHFMPIVEFHPLEDGAGFQLVHHHTDCEEDGLDRASVYTFRKSNEEPGYRVTLVPPDMDLAQEIRVISEADSAESDKLPTYPPAGTVGNPFKELDNNPTL
jgi:hypothetical protein